MSQRESRACWFAAGLLAGAVSAGFCAMVASRRARRIVDGGPGADPLATTSASMSPAAPPPAPTSHQVDGGADMFEYRGFVVHLFWQALGPDRYRAWCDIWEAGAVVQEAGGPPATYLTAAEARLAASAWARHWVQNNG